MQGTVGHGVSRQWEECVNSELRVHEPRVRGLADQVLPTVAAAERVHQRHAAKLDARLVCGGMLIYTVVRLLKSRPRR